MLITDLDQVTPMWLNRLLRGVEVVRVEKKAPLVGNSTIVPLEATYADGKVARFILKMAAGNPREVEFYTAIVADADLPVIRCFDAVYEAESDRLHLLMEDLSATHDFHPPSFLPPTRDNSVRIVNALADIHAYWWEHPRLAEKRPTPQSITHEIAKDAERFTRFTDFLGDRLSPTRTAIFERLFNSLPQLRIRQLVAGTPLTLIHDDPHAGNFLYARDPSKDRLRVIDWKSWSINPGVSDLAHMMAVIWFPERRQLLQDALLRRYHTRLMEKGVIGYVWDTCWHDYRLCVIAYLLYPVWQWSMGAPDIIWWNNLERVMSAYHDLNCAELLI